MLNLKNLAKKANGGDKEALTILILEMPSGLMGDMKPEEFAKKMDEDGEYADDVCKMERPYEDAFSAYSEEHDPGDSNVEGDIAGLLEAWTERDPDTDAGAYYNDLKELHSKHFS